VKSLFAVQAILPIATFLRSVVCCLSGHLSVVCHISALCLNHRQIYTVVHKKRATLFLTIIHDGFLHLLYQWKQE